MTSSSDQSSPMPTSRRLLLGGLRAYQLLLSPLTGPRCRFYPCCSNYAIDAVQQHGCARGLWLSLKRVLRCNPICAGGYDPVPDASSVRK